MTLLILLIVCFIGWRAVGGALRAGRRGSSARELYERRLRAGPGG